MAASLQHRGPDQETVWTEPAAGLAFAHRRLSIIDLSERGSQPMHSQCGRYVIAYNGECYNFRETRDRLVAEGCAFRGTSDTEVILEASARWGLSRTLERINGMFAFAIWDRQKQQLVLARDRLGIKPLYYGWIGSAFWFGSELKALRALQSVQPELDLQSLGLFFQHGYIPAPYSIFAGIRKLQASHTITLRSPSDRPKPQCYWPVLCQFARSEHRVFTGNEKSAQEELDRLLRRAVSAQMVSDVPLGAFLSGGIDSSTVVALMQDQSTRPIQTFTVGFEESRFDEAAFARKVAEYLGTNHTEIILTAPQAQEIVPMLGEIFDEPFADASQIPTFAVSRLARQHVTVSLSGDGGDELFAGYHHYETGADRLGKLARMPGLAQRCLAAGAIAVAETAWDRILGLLQTLPPMRAMNLSGYKVHQYADICGRGDIIERYRSLNARWFAPDRVLPGWQAPPANTGSDFSGGGLSLYDRMAAFDLRQYLPDDILTKVDRASMAVSLESRVPLLDHEVVSFALSVPLAYKRQNGTGKLLLRRVLEKYLPRGLFERPKKGFSVPISNWIRGPLRPWTESIMGDIRANYAEILDCKAIDRKWQEHLSGRRDWGELLWPVLMFQAWMEHQHTSTEA